MRPTGTPLASYGKPRSPIVRVVDPDTATEKPAGLIGEIWVHGENVSSGYWRRPVETKQTFGATIAAPSPGTPEDRWLKTGDLGFFSEGELFIVGRIKDLLIVRGRNHYPDDIEATVPEISRGRAAAIAIVDENTEKLVVIVEVKKRGAVRGGGDRKPPQHPGRSHLGNFQFAWRECPGCRTGSARLDSHHHERKGQAGNLCRPNIKTGGFQRLDV